MSWFIDIEKRGVQPVVQSPNFSVDWLRRSVHQLNSMMHWRMNMRDS